MSGHCLRPTLAAVVGLLALVAGGTAWAAGERDIKIVLATTPDNFDACNTTSEIGIIVQENIAETLTQLSAEDSQPMPRLALSWEQVDPTTWRVKLRQGVKFHDGSDFNAETAAASINRMFNPRLDCLNRMKLFTNIKLTPTVVDTYTLDIKTEKPQVLMPVLLSFVSISSPKTDESALSRSPIGTGPYKFKSWDNQVFAVERFDGYWGERPQVEGATYLWRGESALRAAMVAVGEADLATDIATQDATDPKMDFPYLNGETTRLRFTFKPPLDDIRVRKAINLAVDRDGLREGLFTDDFVPATQLFLPKINGYNPDLKVWPYDPAMAKKLLAEAKAAGVPVDREIRLIARTSFYPNGQEAMQAIMQMLQAVGLNIKLQMMDRAQWLKLVNKPFSDDRGPLLIQEMHDNTSGDATFTMHFRYHTKGQQSEISYPDLDKLLDEADAASGERRRELYRAANKMASEEIVPDVMMFHMINNLRVGPRLDFKPTKVTSAMLELADIKFAKQ